MKHNLETANIIALEALDEQLDRYAASVPLGSRIEGGRGRRRTSSLTDIYRKRSITAYSPPKGFLQCNGVRMRRC